MNIVPYRAKLRTCPAGEKTWRSLPDSSVGKVSTPTGKIRLLTNSPKFFKLSRKTVEATFHACVYKKASGTSSSPEASIKTAATYLPL